MEVNNTFSVGSLQNASKPTQNYGTDYLNDLAGFKDAAKVDIADHSVKIMDTRELSDKTQQFLADKNVDLAKDSTTFNKQNILAHAGSYTAAQGHASAVATRVLLS